MFESLAQSSNASGSLDILSSGTGLTNVQQPTHILPIPKKSRIIKTDKPRPFICSICTRGFVRQEHLKRHQRAHTNEKPFLCVFCGRCFARRDLVLRHQYKLHATLISKDTVIDEAQETIALTGPEQLLPEAIADKSIVKILGNKETILPTPNNPLAQTNAQLKKAAKEALCSTTPSPNSSMRQKKQEGGVHKSSKKSSPTVINVKQSSPFKLEDDLSAIPANLNLLSIPENTTDARNLTDGNTRRNKRHASFSASSAFTYIPDNSAISAKIRSEMESLESLPHQVGFSTPQLTAQQLLEKAVQTGVMDYVENDIPGFVLNEPAISPGNANKQSEYQGNWISNKEPSALHMPSQANPGRQRQTIGSSRSSSSQLHLQNSLFSSNSFLNACSPLLSGFLTMGSSMGGSGGFTKFNNTDSNLDYFSYKSQFNNEASASISETHAFPSLFEGERPPDIGSTKMGVEQPLSTKDVTDDDEQWLAKFFLDGQVDEKLQLNVKAFNEIGFQSLHPKHAVINDYTKDTPDPGTVNSDMNTNARSTPDIFSGSTTVTSIKSNTDFGGLDLEVLTKRGRPDQQQQGREQTPKANYSDIPTNPNSHDCNESETLERSLSSIFTSRQIELLRTKIQDIPSSTLDDCHSIITNGDVKRDFVEDSKGSEKWPLRFTNEYRDFIIKSNKLNPDLFPSVDELNQYVKLYHDEFHTFFPFVHIHSLVPDQDNYPLLLSIAMIGALYGFHSTHAMLLCSLAKKRIKFILETNTGHHEDIEFWVIQSLTLVAFIGVFTNDPAIAKSMDAQLMILIYLIKKTHSNLPYENFHQPPIQSDHVLDYQDNPITLAKYRAQYSSEEQMKKNFQYFIDVQTRIRTCHTILVITNLFTTLAGMSCSFHSIDLKCGVPCYHEDLFFCENHEQWFQLLNKYKIILDSKFSLIELSNGASSYEHCLMYLSNGSHYIFENTKISYQSLLSLLVSLHEKIHIEKFSIDHDNPNDSTMNNIRWKMNSIPIITSMLKHWESIYIKNGGTLSTDDAHMEIIQRRPALKLIIPLYLFAKIRRAVDLTPVIKQIWLQDWKAMDAATDHMGQDIESLREATRYALEVVDFWLHSVQTSGVDGETASKTPIFTITCIFSSIFIIAEYMKCLEDWAKMGNDFSERLSDFKVQDKIGWLKVLQTFKAIETHLTSNGYKVQSYLEFLRVQTNTAHDVVDKLDDNLLEHAMKSGSSINEALEVIARSRMSSRCLYFGLRILGDAPVWPIALLFAQALQTRAIHIERRSTNQHKANLNQNK